MSVLEDKDEIREVMAAYCQSMDACRFDDLAQLFAEDAVWTTDYGEAKGRQAIKDFISGIVPKKGEGPQRKHYITNIIIKVDGDNAKVVSDYLIIRESESGLIPVMGGTYKDDFVKRSGKWYFGRKQLVHDIKGDMALKNGR
jgi:uncharacterized protein (TIGR02246 family)